MQTVFCALEIIRGAQTVHCHETEIDVIWFTLHEPKRLPFDRQTIHNEKDMQKNGSNA